MSSGTRSLRLTKPSYREVSRPDAAARSSWESSLEALFAARRLKEEELIGFSPGGAVGSNARGIERASALLASVRAKAQRSEEVTRMLRAGGTALDVVAAVIRTDGGALPCVGPDADATYRLALVDEVVTLERLRPAGGFEPVGLDA